MTTSTQTPEGTSRLNIDVELTSAGGVRVPISMTIDYPDGHGLHVYQYLDRGHEELLSQIAQELVHRGDASVVQAVLNVQSSGDDEDWRPHGPSLGGLIHSGAWPGDGGDHEY